MTQEKKGVLYLSTGKEISEGTQKGLIELVHNPEPNVRSAAIELAEALNVRAPLLVAELIQMLEAEHSADMADGKYHAELAESLAKIGAIEALPRMLYLVSSQSPLRTKEGEASLVRIWEAIGSFGPRAANIVLPEASSTAMYCESPRVRAQVLKTIKAMGQAGQDALVRLAIYCDGRIWLIKEVGPLLD